MDITEKLESGEFYHIYNHGAGERDLFREPDNYEYFLGLYDKYISPIADTYAWVLMPNHFHVLVRIKENVIYRYAYNERLGLIDAKRIIDGEGDVDADRIVNADRSNDAVRLGEAVRFRFEEVKWQTISLNEPPDLIASKGPVSVDRRNNIDKSIRIKEFKIPQPHLHFSHMANAYSKYINKLYETRGALFERPFKRRLIDSKGYLKQAFIYIHNNPVYHGFCSRPGDYPWSSYETCTSKKKTKLKRDEVLQWFDNLKDFATEHEKDIERDDIERWLEM